MQHLIAWNHIIRTQTKHFLRASNIDLWQEELTPTFYQTDKYINVIDLYGMNISLHPCTKQTTVSMQLIEIEELLKSQIRPRRERNQ
jgi:hypothetical protein